MNRKWIVALLVGITVFAISAIAFAQEGGGEAVAIAGFEMKKWIAMAAGFGIAIAVVGGAIGQGRTAATALDGIARNPGAADKMFTPMILGLALIESLVIYALIIAFILVGKV